MLNVDTAKNICMMKNTDVGRLITREMIILYEIVIVTCQ